MVYNNNNIIMRDYIKNNNHDIIIKYILIINVTFMWYKNFLVIHDNVIQDICVMTKL